MRDRDRIIEVMARALCCFDGCEYRSLAGKCCANEHLDKAERALTALEASGMAVVAGWRAIERAPKGRKVIVAYRNRLGNWRQVMACYFGPETLDSDETEDGFASEGWYEESDTQENLLRTDEPPTYWRPLLPFPDDGKAERPEGSAEGEARSEHTQEKDA